MREQMAYPFAAWKRLFAERMRRPLPDPFSADPQLHAARKSLARSLAIFQLGESGRGTIIEQARSSRIRGIDADYVEAISLFVAEEHRHAEMLACGVRMLGGELIRSNWTAKLFVFGRRLIGLRLKVIVLLAAEVVGICFYHLLASRLPRGQLNAMLDSIVEDELSHLDFHCCFFRQQLNSAWRRATFRIAWRALSRAAAITVIIDHRRTLRDLEIPIACAWRRWLLYAHHAETLACDTAAVPDPTAAPV